MCRPLEPLVGRKEGAIMGAYEWNCVNFSIFDKYSPHRSSLVEHPEVIMIAKEDTGCCERYWCGVCRALDIHIMPNGGADGEKAFSVSRYTHWHPSASASALASAFAHI